MKKIFIYIILTNIFIVSYTQNLIMNSDFEDYTYYFIATSCNDTIYKPTYWYNPTYYSTLWYLSTIHNTCIGNNGIWAGVPQNMWGYRWAYSGNAYVLMGSSVYLPEYPDRNQRPASLQTELIEPLTIGKKYCVSFWISYPENYPEQQLCSSFNYSKQVGALFSTYKKIFIGNEYDYLPPGGLPVQIENNKENWLDTTGWYLVSGSFVADSNYRYMTLSHFKPDSLLESVVLCPYDYTQGVYIDMVSVYDCTGHTYTANAGGNKSICVGERVSLGTDNDSRRQYFWSPGIEFADSTEANPSVSPTQTTTYYLRVIDEFVQESYDTVTVEVLYCNIFIPNIFSPNGDGQNDVLYVRGQGISQLHFVVYNRWGQQVFESRDINHGWDGTFQGQKAEIGVYGYFVSGVVEDGKMVSKRGTVTLVR